MEIDSYKCVICQKPAMFENGSCDNCGNKMNKYLDYCYEEGKMPSREDFSRKHNPKIWDYFEGC